MTSKQPTHGFDEFGNPITAEYLAEAVAEAEAGYDIDPITMIGRPSLTGEARHSPRISFRIPDELRERATTEAEQRGCTLSELAREALERYLAS